MLHKKVVVGCLLLVMVATACSSKKKDNFEDWKQGEMKGDEVPEEEDQREVANQPEEKGDGSAPDGGGQGEANQMESLSQYKVEEIDVSAWDEWLREHRDTRWMKLMYNPAEEEPKFAHEGFVKGLADEFYCIRSEEVMIKSGDRVGENGNVNKVEKTKLIHCYID